MQIDKDILDQIDRALNLYAEHRARAQFDDLSDLGYAVHAEVETVVSATIERIAPPSKAYRGRLGTTLVGQIGSLKALRRDYEDGYLETVHALVRADVFRDFLEMAEYLLEQGYKDPAAVLIGGVLEDHLRWLCAPRAIEVVVNGRPKKADAINSELARAGAYNNLDQKAVTAWLDLRNKAAHGKFDEYSGDQVGTLLAGVRDFIRRVAV
jgi:hypothetical protein